MGQREPPAGLECIFSEGNDVFIDGCQLPDTTVQRSEVLASLAETSGTATIPVSREAFLAWRSYESAQGSLSISELAKVIQAGVFLQDAHAVKSAASRIAFSIRREVQTAFTGLQFNVFILPAFYTLKGIHTEGLTQLGHQLSVLKALEIAEVVPHLQLVEVLAIQQTFKDAELLARFCSSQRVLDVARQLQSGLPKFVRSVWEAFVPTLSESEAVEELHLPARCFSDANVEPLQPIYGFLPMLEGLAIVTCGYVGPAASPKASQIAKVVGRLSANNLRTLTLTVPDPPAEATRISARSCAPIRKLVQQLQSFTNLTALNLTIPLQAIATETSAPHQSTFLSAFPNLQHLALMLRYNGCVDEGSAAESDFRRGEAVREHIRALPRVLTSLLHLPPHLRSLRLEFDSNIRHGSLAAAGFLLHFRTAREELLCAQACAPPLYAHLTYLVFCGQLDGLQLPLEHHNAITSRVELLGPACQPGSTGTPGTLRADAEFCLTRSDDFRDDDLQLKTTLGPLQLPPRPITEEGAGEAVPHAAMLQLNVRTLLLGSVCQVGRGGTIDAVDIVRDDEWGGYAQRLFKAFSPASGSSGRAALAQGVPQLVGAGGVHELVIRKTFIDTRRGHESRKGRCWPEGTLWQRIVRAHADRLNAFRQMAAMPNLSVRKFSYILGSDLHFDALRGGEQPRSTRRGILQCIERRKWDWTMQTQGAGLHGISEALVLGPAGVKVVSIDLDGLADTVPYEVELLRVLVEGFPALRSLELLAVQSSWAPEALHRRLVAPLHGLSSITTLTHLTAHRVPEPCQFIEVLSTLVGLQQLNVAGVEHDGDAMMELGVYLKPFTELQRLDLIIHPIREAACAAGWRGRSSRWDTVYGSYKRAVPGRLSFMHAVNGLDDSGEDDDDELEAAILAEMCGVDVEDLLESELEGEEDDDFVEDGDFEEDEGAGLRRGAFWKGLWRGLAGLPLSDGTCVEIIGMPGEARLRALSL